MRKTALLARRSGTRLPLQRPTVYKPALSLSLLSLLLPALWSVQPPRKPAKAEPLPTLFIGLSWKITGIRRTGWRGTPPTRLSLSRAFSLSPHRIELSMVARRRWCSITKFDLFSSTARARADAISIALSTYEEFPFAVFPVVIVVVGGISYISLRDSRARRRWLN